MIALLIDPKILTIPERGTPFATIDDWWNSTNAWLLELQVTAFEWRQIIACAYKLMEEDRFISFERLRRLKNESGVAINPAIVRRLEHRLQDPDFDYGVRTETTFVVDDGTLSIEPADFVGTNAESIRPIIREALANLAVDKTAGNEFAMGLRIASQDLASRDSQLCVNGKVDLTDPEKMIFCLAGAELSQCFHILLSPDEFAEFPAMEIVRNGGTEVIRQIRRQARLLGATDPLPCKLHPMFLKSITESTIANDEVGMRALMRRCAEIAADIASTVPGARLERIRTSKGGSSPVRTRGADEAVAWRTSVSMGGVGWRLNFWRIPVVGEGGRESIEFALVEGKNNSVDIPE